MTSFQAKTGQERPRKKGKKIIVSINSYPTRNTEFQKKKEKKFKKLKNTIIASVQAKIGWKRPRKRENKNYCSNQFLTNLQ